MRRWTLLTILISLLCATAGADQVLYSEDFESGRGDLNPIRRYPETLSVETSAPEGMTGAFPPPSGRRALQVIPSSDFHNLGSAIGGPVIDRRDASQPAVKFEARIFLVPSSSSEDNNFSLIAIDDSGQVTRSERYYRFGYRQASVFFQMFDGADFIGLETDANLGRQLRVPGWHTFSIMFEGSETMRFFVDDQEASFSPIQDSSFPRVQMGVLAWDSQGDIRPLLADDLVITQVSPDAEPREIILESNVVRPEDGTFTTVNGTWHPSVGKSRAQGMTECDPPDNSATAQACSYFIVGGETGTAVFTPNVSATARYEIFVSWSTSGNATNVLYTITHADGQSQMVLDQDGWAIRGSTNANRWVSLGTYRLAAGTSNSIAVTAQEDSEPFSTLNAHRSYADGLRIVPVAGSTTTSSPPRPTVRPTPPAPTPPAPTPAPTPPPATVSANEVTWRSSISSAMAEAQMRGCRTVIYAFTDRSRTCREIESALFTDARVIVALNSQCPVQIDMERDGRTANDFAIYRVPTFIVLDHTGDEIGRHVGPIEAQDLIDLANGR